MHKKPGRFQERPQQTTTENSGRSFTLSDAFPNLMQDFLKNSATQLKQHTESKSLETKETKYQNSDKSSQK